MLKVVTSESSVSLLGSLPSLEKYNLPPYPFWPNPLPPEISLFDDAIPIGPISPVRNLQLSQYPSTLDEHSRISPSKWSMGWLEMELARYFFKIHYSQIFSWSHSSQSGKFVISQLLGQRPLPLVFAEGLLPQSENWKFLTCPQLFPHSPLIERWWVLRIPNIFWLFPSRLQSVSLAPLLV